MSDKAARLNEIAQANANANAAEVELLLAAVKALRDVGVRPRGYDLRTPTDSRHVHALPDDNEDRLMLTGDPNTV